MLIRSLNKCTENIAGDGSVLRELLNQNTLKQISLKPSLSVATVLPGSETKKHKLKTSHEVYYIIEGEGEVEIDNETQKVCSGDAILIPPNSFQKIKNVSTNKNLTFLCIVDPAYNIHDEEFA